MNKIIFAGTPNFALPSLQALINSSHTICAVYTQPDRRAGRGQKLTSSPVKQLAMTNNLPLFQPVTLRDRETQEQLQALQPDMLINVAYGLLLPQSVLDIPKFGCVNIHPSLLPRWRGASPIQCAILAGDTTTGVSIMQMDAGLDTGNIYTQKTISIDPTDTTATLSHKLATLGAKLLLEVLANIENNQVTTMSQDHTLSTYAKKITKEEGKIDWHKSAVEIERMVRAFNPWPIAHTTLNGEYIRIWQAQVVSQHQRVSNPTPGTINHIDQTGIDVITGHGILRLLQIQFPGGKSLTIKDILNTQDKYFTSQHTIS